LLVRKQDKSFRLCTDYRQLNKLTMGYSWPLPDIKFWLQQVAGNQYYAVFDCTQGYHQLSLTTEASWLNGFHHQHGNVPMEESSVWAEGCTVLFSAGYAESSSEGPGRQR
jgi:hypothetical protein